MALCFPGIWRAAVWLMLIISTLDLCSQSALAIEHPGRLRRVIYDPGSTLRFHGADPYQRHHGQIEAVHDTLLVLSRRVQLPGDAFSGSAVVHDYIPFRDIQVVYNDRPTAWRSFRYTYYASTLAGGSSILIAGTLNTLLFAEPPRISQMAAAGSILISGLIVRHLGRDRYRIGRGWQLRKWDG
jgi:hypothetical protein